MGRFRLGPRPTRKRWEKRWELMRADQLDQLYQLYQRHQSVQVAAFEQLKSTARQQATGRA